MQDIKASPLKPPVGPGKPTAGLSLDDLLGKSGKGRIERSGSGGGSKLPTIDAADDLSPAASDFEGAAQGLSGGPAGMGLDLNDLLRSRGATENDSGTAEPFNWGRDIRDEKAGLTTKAKYALLLSECLSYGTNMGDKAYTVTPQDGIS